MRKTQGNVMEQLMPELYGTETKQRSGEVFSNNAPEASKRPFPYNVCTLVIGSLFLFVFFEGILATLEWSNSDNYTNPNCRHLKPIDPDVDLSSLSQERKDRFKAVQNAVRHAWKGYTNVASLDSFWNSGGGIIPHDDLSPVSKKGNSWLHYAATLHDSIDTLYLANMTKEYDEAVLSLVGYDIQTTSPQATKTFEYSLRVLGGLLGAYSVSGDPRLFAAARNAADSILDGPFQASPSILPRPFNVLAPSSSSLTSSNYIWDWRASIQQLYKMMYSLARNRFTREHQTNSLAGFGSFGMEFSFLSTVSGDRRYRKKSDDIFYHVQKYEKNGVVPYAWNVLTGEPTTHGTSLGSGSDSFYEYLIKIPTLNRCSYDSGMEMYTGSCTSSDTDHLKMYEKMVKETLTPFHVKHQSFGVHRRNEKSQHAFPVDNVHQYDHLLCFLPAMLSLGASTKYPTGSQMIEDDKDQHLARQLLDGCAAIYNESETNLSPDTGVFSSEKFLIRDSSYYLRPEFVESLFVIYRVTKDEKLQEMAWDVFQSLEKFCRIPSGGFAVLKDVNDPSKGHIDDMPSFFLAETLKYLLLIFGPDDYVSLDDFVFTTEAHPLRKPEMQEQADDKDTKPLCILACRPPMPVPWAVLCILVIVLSVCLRLVSISKKIARKITIAFGDDKTKKS